VTEAPHDLPGRRKQFEEKVTGLRGRRVTGVDYWDIHNFSSESLCWDYGDWHHAVMGLELTTDSGPVTITWTNTFYPYGVEVFYEPISRHLVLDDDYGPQRVGPDHLGPWTALLDSPITDAVTCWERLELGPATRADGLVVSPARSVDLPTALRIGFEAGSAWFDAAIPQAPDMESVFIPGDEVMVVFSADKMRSMGYASPQFIIRPTSEARSAADPDSPPTVVFGQSDHRPGVGRICPGRTAPPSRGSYST
jgi:hypothetical protein